MGGKTRRLALAACATFALAGSVSGWAQAPAPMPAGFVVTPNLAAADPALRNEYEALFRRILANPSNLDANFRFAEISTQLGDLEAAIGALERILFYNPNLPRVRLELGILYFRLGSYAMARQYFETAISGSDVPETVVLRVQGFLAEIERRTSTTQWSFYGQTGFRYQTNANAGPSNPLVRVIGVDATLDRRFTQRPDWNLFALGSLRHIYDLENQRGDVWETSVVAYNTKQFEIARLNVNLLEVQTGPRLALAPDTVPGAYVRPYLIGGVVALANDFYLGSIGGGVGLGATFGAFQVEPFAEVRRREFNNSIEYQAASDQSGTLWSAGVLFGSPLSGAMRWQSRVAFSRNETEPGFRFYSFDQASADLSLPLEFAGPWGSRPWVLTPYGGLTYTSYDRANPIVDPNIRREDLEWRVGAGIDVPVWENIGLGVQVTYSRAESNIRNFRNENLAVSFGPTLRF